MAISANTFSNRKCINGYSIGQLKNKLFTDEIAIRANAHTNRK
jgi:hypothetical protein